MQKRSLPVLLLLCFCVILFGNCKKSDIVTNTDLITTGKWKISTATVVGVGDVTSQIPACYLDNLYTFFSDGTGTIDEAGNVCSPSTAGTFGWTFTNNETKLSMTNNLIPGGTGEFNMVALSETTLTVSQETALIPAPTPLTIQVTFVHP
jgi:hypothetical protein